MRLDRRQILTTTALGSLAAGALAGCGMLGVDQPPPKMSGPAVYDSLARPGAVVDADTAVQMISGYRRNNGQTPVSLDPVLMRLAQEQARAMAAADRLSHDLSGRGLKQRLDAAGYVSARAAENIGAGYHTLADAFSGWRGSSSHRANMLLPGITRMGIAAAQAPGSKYKVYWLMIVATPA